MRIRRLPGALPALLLGSVISHLQVNVNVVTAFLPSSTSLSVAIDSRHQRLIVRELPVAPLHLKKGGTKKKKAKSNTITVNKLAYRNYEVLETLEVGIALQGTEVKR